METIGALFQRQVEKLPNGVALTCDHERVTYRQLDLRANKLARDFRSKGIRPEALLALSMRRSVDLVAVLLAISKIGGAYVGLDPTWPTVRTAAVLEDSKPALLVADDDHSELMDRFAGEILLMQQDEPKVDAESTERVSEVTTPDHLFSITYTSGTTGRPKGVLVTVRSVLNRLQWMWNAYPFRADDAMLLYRSCASVGFSWDCFGALLNGIETVIRPGAGIPEPAEIVETAVEHHITHLTASASLWGAILDQIEHHPSRKPHLRIARSSGEPLRPHLVERWHRVFPNVPLLNIYGATECAGATAYDTSTVPSFDAKRVPVGKPVTGVQLLVVDDEMQILGVEEEGEICVGGAALARGYLSQAAMTAERFVPNPDSSVFGERVFRTGDLGFWRSNGQLEVNSRRDLQVKIRGFRVELEEVEAALHDCVGVKSAAVGVRHEGDTARLVAFIVSATDSLSARDLRNALLRSLPNYMVPSDFISVTHLPRTASGKVDRHRLRRLAGKALDISEPYIAPQTATEQALVTIWKESLGVDKVGIDDDFFNLGGHSLSAMQIVSRIYELFGAEIGLRTLFDNSTVKRLAAQLKLNDL